MDEFGAAPERTLMIGDTTHDLQLARQRRRAVRRRQLRRARATRRSPSFDAAVRRRTRRAELHDWLLAPWMSDRDLAARSRLCAERRAGSSAARPWCSTCCCWRAPARAFALRFDGRVVAYLNRCAHVPTEMDWQPGEFLDMRQALDPLLDPRRGLRAGRRPLRRRAVRARPPDADRSRPSATAQVYWYPSRDIQPVVFDDVGAGGRCGPESTP